MLEIFYLLEPFFEDVYRGLSVRHYARLQKLSPPTASKKLKEFEKEGLLVSSKVGLALTFRANREHSLFQGFARLYWQKVLHEVTAPMHKDILFRKVVLFGSLAKAENTLSSDVDLYVDIEKKPIDIINIEKKLRRKVQVHFRDSRMNPHLKKNIEDGLVIR